MSQQRSLSHVPCTQPSSTPAISATVQARRQRVLGEGPDTQGTLNRLPGQPATCLPLQPRLLLPDLLGHPSTSQAAARILC